VTWHFWQRLGFRFMFAYVVLYCAPFPLGFIPFARLEEAYSWPWQVLVAWAGSNVFHLAEPVRQTQTGSGDATYNYVLLVCMLAIAVLATAVWSIFDQRSAGYPTLARWLRLYIRFWLASAMISYGLDKVFVTQFPAPFLWKYTEPYGAASPMGLLWMFMSSSPAYTIFAGSIESAAGLLLLWPRSAVAGGLLAAAALGNIVALNLSYDVPVKLYSFHLLLAAFIVLGPNLKAVTDFLLRAQPAHIDEDIPPVSRPAQRRALVAMQALVAMALVVSSLQGVLAERAILAQKPVLYGVWKVEDFSVNGKSLAAKPVGGSRWKRVVIDALYGKAVIQIETLVGAPRRGLASVDPKTQKIVLYGYGRDTPKEELSYAFQRSAPNDIVIWGKYQGQTIRAKLHLLGPKAFPLSARGFHWVNEYPYNL